MTAPLQKAQERLALHEVIRVGVGRQEDLRLLQNVAMQASCLPPASVAQLVREAALREEWRAGREAALLHTLRSLPLGELLGGRAGGPGGALSSADGRLLGEQLAALTEMMEQQQQRRRHRAAAAAPLPRPRAHPSSPLGMQHQQQPQHYPPAAAAGTGRLGRPSYGAPLPGSPYKSGGLVRSASAESTAPLGQDGWMCRQQQLLQQRGASSTAAVAIYTATGSPAVVGSPARALRSSSGGSGSRAPAGRRSSGSSGGGSGGGGQRSGLAAAALRAVRQQKPRPGSAPEDALGGSEAAVGAAAAAAAAAVNANAAAADAAAAGGKGNQRSSGFRNLLRLQQLLMQGLRDHAQQEGEGGALEALAASVAEGQAFFAECLSEALEAAGLPPGGSCGAAGMRASLQQQQPWRGVGGGPTSPPRRLPHVAWDRLLRLGQLGLTRADVARLEELRRRQAARVIQRQVRKWLRRRRHQRRLAEARARADAMQRRLRERAAVVIQAWVRGHLARRLAARLAQQAARERAARRLQAAARILAATRIQRAWRAHRRAVRYAAALARAEARLRQQQQQHVVVVGDGGRRGAAGGELQVPVDAGCESVFQAWSEQRLGGQQQRQQQQEGDRGGGGGCGASSRLSPEQAVVIIQAHLRGWLVRRSSELWWARASQQLRERRAAVRAWRQQQRFMQGSYDMQAQLLGALLREAQVAAALEADRRRQEAELQAAFRQWLLEQQRVALSQPLPRGWVPHPHPEEPARMCFLNTRTGELHSLHPTVAELAGHAEQQHAAARSALQERFAGVPAYVARLHEATAAQAGILLRAIALVHQRVATGAAGGGGGMNDR
ncbi:hypothetical protein Agub_g566 [Astrephomene gubernaculifera]|uniref:Uncharacterized protein n=1 Tax=Astrephomene gubernaculifera TaxID=47775 RepID=A0AAD3DDZ9_9CHLO|nr:hypothetical protein Agub_g566 [Astrephomene gubernaculifera]